LGFVVDQFIKANNFIPEDFWGIKLDIEKDCQKASLAWSRGHIFDEACCKVIFEILRDTNVAVVKNVKSKPTEKWYIFAFASN
jgi:DNA topoisomerase III